MFNFRENTYKQLTSRKAAAMLMRTDLTVCNKWANVLGIIVCVHKEPVP
ncbi:MAG: hypothetical protein JXA96_14715 [Sedimentisphaerales bacterium]|nr:hypothetical protein [Sedimentisphaerales bacterium]